MLVIFCWGCYISRVCLLSFARCIYRFLVAGDVCFGPRDQTVVKVSLEGPGLCFHVFYMFFPFASSVVDL